MQATTVLVCPDTDGWLVLNVLPSSEHKSWKECLMADVWFQWGCCIPGKPLANSVSMCVGGFQQVAHLSPCRATGLLRVS